MITELTNAHLIKGNLQANSKNEVFAELAQMLLENNRISNKEDFLNDIEIREKLSVTSMDGIEYGDEEGIKPTVFFMIASPDNGADHHIYVLQELFGKFSEEFIEDIHNAKNEHQILNILIQS
ncbi:PTS sugar transporter subunit IIA [Vibrio cholerae]|uniref:PTS sugar transporter subunit IIA n=1 Tax=Vibrio cholerae TaxID=666 RepID=UPI001583D698|nr:PTS sugar transporter subunit IIA [Vibrio cholerae]EMC4024391.1 PTS sugar transporter subunit IIA [Vibrio cholerae]QKU89116.1 PTS sugar transporter subunit IIA [Vibrio cholerae]